MLNEEAAIGSAQLRAHHKQTVKTPWLKAQAQIRIYFGPRHKGN